MMSEIDFSDPDQLLDRIVTALREAPIPDLSDPCAESPMAESGQQDQSTVPLRHADVEAGTSAAALRPTVISPPFACGVPVTSSAACGVVARNRRAERT